LKRFERKRRPTTPYGTKRAMPEYEDLRRIATAKKIPLKVLYDEMLRSFKK